MNYTDNIKEQITGLESSEDKVTENVLNALFNNSTIGVYVVQDGKFKFTNSMFQRFVGYSQEELANMDSLSIVHPEDRDMVRENAISMLKGELSFPYEFRYVNKYGESLWTMESVTPIQYRGKQATLGSFIDTTRIKQAEEKYRQLLEDMSDGYGVVQDGKYVFTNSRYCEIFGLESDQVQGKPLEEFLIPENRQEILERYERIMSGEEAPFDRYEGMAKKKDGTLIELEASTKIIKYEDKPALYVILRDVTQCKRAEENYRQLLEDINDGYVVIQDGKYVFANRKFYEMFRYEPGEEIDKPIIQFLMPDSQQVKVQKHKKGVSGGEVSAERYEGKATRKDGTKFLAEAISKPVQYEGKPAFCVIVRDITKRKRAEEALTQSEKKYRELAEGISDVFVALDKDLNYTYWNKAAERVTEISSKDALGKYHGHLFHDNKAAGEAIKYYLEVIRTKKPKQFINKIWLNGKDHTLELNIYPSGDGISVIAKDVTERKQMEELVQQSRERFQALTESTSDFVWEVNEDGIYTYASPRVKHLLGYEPEEVIGKKPFDFMPPEDAEHIAKKFEVIVKSRKPIEGLENINIHKDGRFIVLETNGVPFFDNNGHLCGYRGIDRDITERKRAENTLRESEEKIRLIFESVPEGIILLDLEGKVVDINESVTQMLGYDSKEEIVGRNSTELIAERDHAQAKKDMEKTLETGNIGITRYTFVRKDEGRFPTAASTAVLRDSNGKPRGLVVIATDITIQQRRQEQLMLTDRLASIGQLASGIAHEINNPLTSVIGFSELLLEKNFPKDIIEDIETIDKEAKRAAEVVRGLLTFVRNKGTEKTHVDINEIIKEVLQLRSYEQKTSNIKVYTQLAPDLPQINANGAHMQQVLINLVVNAEQAMTEAHDRGNLSINTEKVGDTIRIAITDDGPGITPENMKNIFSPFFTTKEPGKGTGLGLSICHGIVNEHGGKLYVESEPDKGACFILELPIQAGVVGSEEKVL